jgi:metal-dependent hydrolase (beta-lactamase superfamily II)
MRRLGVEPTGIEVVVLSHIHADRTSGLERFLEENSGVV